MYLPRIGLEVHLELSTESKAFCGCSTRFGAPPNTQTCPVCLGLPGSLPVLNRRALEFALKVACALNCQAAEYTKFDRKNYFYPDLPKNYQISQYDVPLSRNGYLEVTADGTSRRIRIRRVHLEEDTGKLIHEEDYSLIDFNRSGVPLLEIVSEPDIDSPECAHRYLTELKNLLEYLDVSSCDMENGSLRCDVNISLVREDRQAEQGERRLGTKVEIKNLNSFKAVKDALVSEVKRQTDILNSGKEVVLETRLWDEQSGETRPMRTKEEAHDYRYFPEPDLPMFVISEDELRRTREGLPESPRERRERFIAQYKLSEYDASLLTQERATADFLEEAIQTGAAPKQIANWLAGEIASYLNLHSLKIQELKLTPQNLVGMIRLIESGRISGKIAKSLILKMIETGQPAEEVVEALGMTQIKDESALEDVIDEAVARNPKSVADYRAGKENALMFLVGQVMRQTKGRANPQIVLDMLKKRLTV